MHRHIRCRLFIFLGVMTAVLCSTGCNEQRVSDRDIEFVTIDEAYELGEGRTGIFGIGKRKAMWVDPRSSAKYAAGHIPGAVNISLEEVREDHPTLRDYDVFIVYGDDYNAPIAKAMVKRLIAAGYDDSRTLRGGLNGWKKAGNEVAAD